MECFSPYRVVGSICNDIPVSWTYLYGNPILMVATGKTFQLYKGKELAMVRGGPTFLQPVKSVAQSGKYRFVAEGPRIHAFVHHKPLWTVYHEPITKPNLRFIMAVDDLLFCVGQDKQIVVRDVKTGEKIQAFLTKNNETLSAWSILFGYENKLIAATEEGSIHLYNFKTGVCIWHEQREKGKPILSLTCSVYKDIVAYGTALGKVVLFNVGSNETITSFEHTQGSAVTSLAFRVDRDGFLVSGTSMGEVAIWDIENRCLDGMLTRGKAARTEADVLDNPHSDIVHSLITFSPSSTSGATTDPQLSNLLVSCGADNALMQYRFDTVDGLGILVRERRGHTGSCTAASFYNNDLLITGGLDRAVRVTHVFSDRASWELSQGKLGKRGREKQLGREALKLPPTTAIASSTSRNYQWASVVTIHEASAQTCGWRMDTRAIESKFSGIATSSHCARAVMVSECGNFAVIGYSSGNAVIVSLQNKSIKQLVDASLRIPGDKNDHRCVFSHGGSVECVEIACENTVIITAALDGIIKMWNLFTGDLIDSINTRQPMTKSCLHRPSSLFIVAQHFTIRAYACHTAQIATDAKVERAKPVRTFEGHTAPITALALSPDTHRYLVSSSGDGALLIWDLAAAACVGQYRFHSPANSLAFHPDALFLVTTHAGERGVHLWVNNLRYGYVPEVLESPQSKPQDSIPWLHFPTSHGAVEDELIENQEDALADHTAKGGITAEEEVELFDPSTDIALLQKEHTQKRLDELNAIAVEGLSISDLPKHVWYTLPLLDQIKEKNVPLLPPKKKDVPFFLPTSHELHPTFVVSLEGQDSSFSSPSTRVIASDLMGLSPFQRLLVSSDYDGGMNHLLKLGTAQAIDLELQQVANYIEETEYTEEELQQTQNCLKGLLRFFTEWLRRGKNVDLVQGMIASTVRAHGYLLTRFGDGLTAELEGLAAEQDNIRRQLDHMVSFPSCLVGTFSGSIV